LELIGEVGGFDSTSGAGVAVQIDVEDAIGLGRQAKMLADRVGGSAMKRHR